MSSLYSNKKLLLKYCYCKDSGKMKVVVDFIENCNHEYIIAFIVDYFKKFLLPFFLEDRGKMYPDIRAGFNIVRGLFVEFLYSAIKDMHKNNRFYVKDSYEYYSIWLDKSGLLDTAKGTEIYKEEHIATAFTTRYVELFYRKPR